MKTESKKRPPGHLPRRLCDAISELMVPPEEAADQVAVADAIDAAWGDLRRTLLAGQALQGMLANMALTKTVDDKVNNPAEFNAYFATCAAQMADALLAALDAPKETP